jgi:hypothetical protein
MSGVQIAIELQSDRRAYAPGEEIRGVVRLGTSGPHKCRAVYLEVGWKTSGRGDTDQGGNPRVELLPGPSINGPLEIQFSSVLPLAPHSYTGQLVKITWAVTVRVDEPWAKDSVHSEPFELRA